MCGMSSFQKDDPRVVSLLEGSLVDEVSASGGVSMLRGVSIAGVSGGRTVWPNGESVRGRCRCDGSSFCAGAPGLSYLNGSSAAVCDGSTAGVLLYDDWVGAGATGAGAGAGAWLIDEDTGAPAGLLACAGASLPFFSQGIIPRRSAPTRSIM